jgi:hypothetical protein
MAAQPSGRREEIPASREKEISHGDQGEKKEIGKRGRGEKIEKESTQ